MRPSSEDSSEAVAGDCLARMTLDGHITRYHPRPALVVQAMAAGVDGNLWLAVYGRNEIVRMTTSGRIVARYHIQDGSRTCDTICTLGGITAGPDGNTWFTVEEGMISHIAGTGKITLLPLVGKHLLNFPFAITVGPDERLWFSALMASRVGAVTTGGRTQEYIVPGTVADVFPGIAEGGDHSMWLTQTCSSDIRRVTSAGQFTSYHIPGTSRTAASWCPYFMP
jgi:virginiamycin B lyase